MVTSITPQTHHKNNRIRWNEFLVSVPIVYRKVHELSMYKKTISEDTLHPIFIEYRQDFSHIGTMFDSQTNCHVVLIPQSLVQINCFTLYKILHSLGLAEQVSGFYHTEIEFITSCPARQNVMLNLHRAMIDFMTTAHLVTHTCCPISVDELLESASFLSLLRTPSNIVERIWLSKLKALWMLDEKYAEALSDKMEEDVIVKHFIVQAPLYLLESDAEFVTHYNMILKILGAGFAIDYLKADGRLLVFDVESSD